MGETANTQKSYFDVMGICCPSEVPLIEKILAPVNGVRKVSVIVTSKTVIVEHDSTLINQFQIEKILNKARLEATIRTNNTGSNIKKWPSLYIVACGIFLLLSLLQIFFHPLKWLALASVAFGLPPIVFRSFVAVRRLMLDINILMLIAVGGAIALRDYSEAGFIVFLFTIAEWLETWACHKATDGMTALMNMAPQKATLAETGQLIDARDVKVGTILAVKAGEVIPIDGTVVEGKSEVNEQSLTGESFPVAKQVESPVWAGTLNIDGYITVETTALAENSAVAKMASLVEEAQNNRSKTQRLIDSCARFYTPGVVVIAAGVAIIPLTLHVLNRKHWFQLALVLLVSACPCALVLSTPVATFCSLLTAARLGLIVKGGDVLEALAKTKVVAFDKTGTITRGDFVVVELFPVDSHTEAESLIYWISSIECKSSHPMASALIEHARSKSIEPKPESVSEFQIIPGEGVYGEIDGHKLFIGNKRIAVRAGCNTVPCPNLEVTRDDITRGYVFSNAMLIGTFSLSDSCRTGVAEAIQELKYLGIKISMLTGDSFPAAMHANIQLGNAIEIVHAELLPQDKAGVIKDLKKEYGPITMVGDGMNDAPALATADVGISMGISGSAVAMETSHITLMSNDITKIAKAIKLARRTHHKIMGNIIISSIPKIGILSLAIAGHPILWAAVLADVGTCLVVILNSMMLLHVENPKSMQACSLHKAHVHNHGHGAHRNKHCSNNTCKLADEDHAHDKQKSDCDGHRRRHDQDHGDDTHAHDHQPSLENCCNGSGKDNHGQCHSKDGYLHCGEEHHHIEECCNKEKEKHYHYHDVHIHCNKEQHDDYEQTDPTAISSPQHVISINGIDNPCSRGIVENQSQHDDYEQTDPTAISSPQHVISFTGIDNPCSRGVLENQSKTDAGTHCNMLTENIDKIACCSSAQCKLRRGGFNNVARVKCAVRVA